MSHPADDLPIPSDHEIPTWNPGEEPKCIYHYTNSAGLTGIINSKTLWATETWYMNDTGEATYSLEAVRQFLASIKPETDETREFCNRVTEIFDDWRQRINDEWKSKGNLQNYIACLSENGDQLSQWRAYGSGRGFSIGFDGEVLRKLISSYGNSTMISKVIYDESAQRAILSDAYRRAQAVLNRRNDSDAQSNDTQFTPLTMALSIFLSTFLATSSSFKHPAFSEEAESRILVTRSFANGKPSADIKFRESALGITPYVAIPLCFPSEEHISGIREIIVGPQSHTVEVQRAVGQFLAANGLSDVEIVPSEVPLRA